MGTFDCVTPFHDACISGSVGCVRILVDAGAVVSVHVYYDKRLTVSRPFTTPVSQAVWGVSVY